MVLKIGVYQETSLSGTGYQDIWTSGLKILSLFPDILIPWYSAL
jgi:hypothetical protein